MKIRFFAALLLAALILLSGCAAEATVPEQIQPALTTVDAPAVPLAPSPRPAAPAPTQTPAVPTEPPTLPAPVATESKQLTEAEAISIALADAGFTENQVTRLRAEFDYDDGRPEYEVEFHKDGFEYDYEIHGATGEILSRDKDRDR